MATRKTPASKDETTAVLEKIATWPSDRRVMGERLHELITREFPELIPRLWYGMPGYAKGKSAPVLVFFRTDAYMTFGLTEKAAFQREPGAEDNLMPTSWFFEELDAATEARIVGIIRGGLSETAGQVMGNRKGMPFCASPVLWA